MLGLSPFDNKVGWGEARGTGFEPSYTVSLLSGWEGLRWGRISVSETPAYALGEQDLNLAVLHCYLVGPKWGLLKLQHKMD